MSKRQSLSGGPPMFQSIALTMPERYAQRQAECATDAPPANDDSYDFVSGYYDTAGEDDDGGAAPTTQTYFRQLAASKSAAEMSGIDQTLKYFDWTGRGSSRGLEQQIINELQLVDSAMVHSLVLPDDRTADLVAVLDRGIEECWDLERKLMVYKLQLKSLAENFKTVDAKKTASSTVSSMLDPALPRTQKCRSDWPSSAFCQLTFQKIYAFYIQP